MKFRHHPAILLASLTMALPAAADVIYSNFQNITIPTTYSGIYLDVETGDWNTDMFNPVAGWDINPYFGGSTLANSPAFQPVRSGTGSLDSVVNLTEGTTIGSGSTFSTFVQEAGGQNPGGPGYGGSETHLGNGAGQFADGVEGYLGFRLNGTDYGSMRVVFTNNTGGAVIKDWAYDTSGNAVVAGAIKQVGQDVIISSGFTLASALIDSGGPTNLVKNGVGTNTLNAVSTYTGSTQVNEGTLVIGASGSLAAASAVTVSNSGSALVVNGTIHGTLLANASTTVSGTGTVVGNATIQGIHNPGNSPGIQTFDSNLTYSGGSSVVNWELSANTVSNLTNPNAVFDQILVGGDLDFNNLTTLNLSFATAGSSVLWSDSLWDSAQSWVLYDVAGATTGFANLSLNTLDWLDSSGTNLFNTVRPDGGFALVQSGSDVVLSYSVIPEPAAALLGSLGLLTLLRRRRSA